MVLIVLPPFVCSARSADDPSQRRHGEGTTTATMKISVKPAARGDLGPSRARIRSGTAESTVPAAERTGPRPGGGRPAAARGGELVATATAGSSCRRRWAGTPRVGRPPAPAAPSSWCSARARPRRVFGGERGHGLGDDVAVAEVEPAEHRVHLVDAGDPLGVPDDVDDAGVAAAG